MVLYESFFFSGRGSGAGHPYALHSLRLERAARGRCQRCGSFDTSFLGFQATTAALAALRPAVKSMKHFGTLYDLDRATILCLKLSNL